MNIIIIITKSCDKIIIINSFFFLLLTESWRRQRKIEHSDFIPFIEMKQSLSVASALCARKKHFSVGKYYQ